MKFCRQVLTSPTKLQNMSFHLMNSKRTTAKCSQMKNAWKKREELRFSLLLNIQICEFLVMVASASYLSRIPRPDIGGSIPPQNHADAENWEQTSSQRKQTPFSSFTKCTKCFYWIQGGHPYLTNSVEEGWFGSAFTTPLRTPPVVTWGYLSG